MAILIIFRKSCDLPSEQFLRIPNGQWYKTECVYIESMHGARCGLGLKPVKAIQIVPELKRKFHIRDINQSVFCIYCSSGKYVWCGGSVSRLSLVSADPGLGPVWDTALPTALGPPGESHSHINIALLEVVITKADQRQVGLMSLWMMLKTFLELYLILWEKIQIDTD